MSKKNSYIAKYWRDDESLLEMIDHSEDKVQATFCTWLNIFYPEQLYYAIPNGGYRTKSNAVTLRNTGVKAGIPDLHFPFPKGIYNSLYIELKRKKRGVLSINQKKWIDDLRDQGHYVGVAKGFKECVRIFEEYVNL